MLNNNKFVDFLNTKSEYPKRTYSFYKKSFIKLIPKVGAVYLVRFGFNSTPSKHMHFLSKHFLGRCIFIKRKNSHNALFCLRNIYNRYPIELRFFLNSPVLFKIIYMKEKSFRRNKLNFFKKLSVFKSKI